MGSHENLDVARSQVGKNLLSLLALHDTRQQFNPDVHALQERADGLQMLFGKDFRRSHHTCLITIVQGDEHGHQRHERLARTHIALQESVHLSSAAHIGSDFVHHPFLRPCQFEGEMVGIEAVEDVGDAVEDIASVFASLVAGISQDVELHVEEFLEFQSYLSLLHLLMRVGIMNHAKGGIVRYEVQPVYDAGRQCLGQGWKDAYQFLCNLLDGA